MTSLHDVFGQEVNSLSFLLFSLFTVYFIHKIYAIYKQEGVSNLFVFFLLMFLILLSLNDLSSPSPDFLVITFLLFIFSRIVDLSSQKEEANFGNYIPIVILSVYLITAKMASIPVLLLSVFVCIKFIKDFKRTVWLLPFLILIVIPWLVRNIILTGLLIYPFPLLDLFGFDWKMPLENVNL
ncbi:LIC_10190 family membrane protein [Flavobacterium pallidum]|uniref:LIC_10190 family membrane protein n=1 Tax=Flavobacterium pallidum TaxID=2172098 RepID=UPI0037432B82